MQSPGVLCCASSGSKGDNAEREKGPLQTFYDIKLLNRKEEEEWWEGGHSNSPASFYWCPFWHCSKWKREGGREKDYSGYWLFEHIFSLGYMIGCHMIN